MGMYTRLVLNVAISAEAPIIKALKMMVEGSHKVIPGVPEGRMCWMLKSSSYYHDNINHASLEHDAISKSYKLSVTCDLKNYENEIEAFVDMIAPWVETKHMAGYMRYEEDTQPSLLWFVGGKASWFKPVLPSHIARVD